MAAPRHDWYAAEWLDKLGKSQADVARDLDWNKARVSLMVRGLQPYDRDSLNELAFYLNLDPFELLLPPDRAMALRQYRASAEQIITLVPDLDPPAPVSLGDRQSSKRKSAREGSPSPRRTGTHD